MQQNLESQIRADLEEIKRRMEVETLPTELSEEEQQQWLRQLVERKRRDQGILNP